MGGRVDAIVLAVALLAALCIVAVDLVLGARTRYRTRRSYSMACPAHGLRVRCTMLEDDRGTVGDVASCSAFRPRSEVTCDKTCVAYLNMLGRRRPRPIG